MSDGQRSDLCREAAGRGATLVLDPLQPVSPVTWGGAILFFALAFVVYLRTLALPTLAVNLLSTEWYMHELEGGYYNGAPLAPIVIVSAVYAVAWIVRRFAEARYPRARLLPVVLAALVLLATLLYHHAYGLTPLAADAVRY